MVKIRENSPSLVEAVLVWTGWKQEGMPRRKDSFVVEHFGVEAATELLAEIRSLENDFYSSDARFVADSLQEMGMMAAEQFKKKHPDLEDDIADAFAWCYTYDYK